MDVSGIGIINSNLLTPPAFKSKSKFFNTVGIVKQLYCRDCGAEWDMFIGVGMSSRILSCNSCNKQYEMDNPMPSDTDLKVCECGGKLTLKPKRFICPECNGKNIKSEDVGLWD